jgi:glycosyltransferase involved in cell wall biosynthesis
MPAPLVSVIIPVYNAQDYIQQTILSVLEQTIADIELIVLNDGSTDNSEKVILALQQTDKRIRYQYKPNSGVSDTRNKGLALAQGRYIAFLDADDIWKPDNLEKKLQILEATGKQWVFSNLEYIDENNKPLQMTVLNFKPYDIVDNLLLWEGDVVPGPCSNILASRKLFNGGVEFDTHLSSPADRDICIQLALKAEPVYLDEKLWQYRQHSKSMTNVNKKVVGEVLYFVKKAKASRWFSNGKIRKKSLSNIYLMIAGISYKFTGQKMLGIGFLIRSFLYSPGNIWKKKISRAFDFLKK